MDLLGDIAGIYELIVGFTGILLYKIAEHSFIMTVIKEMFFINIAGNDKLFKKHKNHFHECYYHEDKIKQLFMKTHKRFRLTKL